MIKLDREIDEMMEGVLDYKNSSEGKWINSENNLIYI